MRNAIRLFWPLLCLLLSLGSFALAEPETAPKPPSVNKLLYMFKIFYLPFDIEFREGRGPNDILAFYTTKKEGILGEPIKVEELQELDLEWAKLREPWKKKSLLLTTPIERNTSSHITQRIISHFIPLARGPFDNLPINDRIQINHLLADKSEKVQEDFKQLRFLKSFMGDLEESKFNFFIFSPSWCQSSREYRFLLEQFIKEGNYPELVLHSVVIDDPKEEIFDSRLMKELFPHADKYTHDNVPRFLAYEMKGNRPMVYEEGAALKELYERFLKEQKGRMSSQITLFKKRK